MVGKVIDFIKNNKYMHYSIIFAIGVILSLLLINIRIRETHDGFFHLLRLIGSVDSIKMGQFPIMIISSFCDTCGYSMTLFYPPLVTYIPLLLKLITPLSFSFCLKFFGALSIIASGYTMYSFILSVTKKRSIALFAAIIYMIAPYKLIDVYKRYAIGEFVALIFMPTLFKGMYNLFEGDGKKHYFIAIGATLLMLCHTITTVYAAILCVIYILFNIKKLKEIDILKKIVINVIFIVTLSMLFFVPMFEAKQKAEYTIFDHELMRTVDWYAAENSIKISDLFIDQKNPDRNDLSFTIGIPIIILFASTIFAFRKVDTKYKNIYIAFLMSSIISLYMATKYFPWQIMPNFLCTLQYPWRMIGFFNFFSSLICAVNIYIILKVLFKKDLFKLIVFIILLVISILYTLNFLNQYKTEKPSIDNAYENWVFSIDKKLNHMYINRDYLPIKALHLQKTYMNDRENKTLVLEGNAEIINEEKFENLVTTFEINEASRDTVLEFAYIYYPGYKVRVTNEDNSVNIYDTCESEHGYASLKLPEDIKNAKVKVYFEPTLLTKLSYLGSFIAFIVFIVYIIKQKIGEKNEK